MPKKKKHQAQKTSRPKKDTTTLSTPKPVDWLTQKVQTVRAYLRRVSPSSVRGRLILAIILITSISLASILKDLPSPTNLRNQYPASTLIYDRNGVVLYEIYSDQNRIPIKLDDLPDAVKQATISIEDQSFYYHFGFSVQGIIRALRNTVFKNKLQGGSTITQQLVKTTLLTPERTIARKIREAVLTLAVEILYSKNDILEMYLNHIPYGGTAYGIEAASHRFFDKSAKDLTLSEATLLAGLPQAPTRYSPFTNPENSKSRQEEVLRRMVEDGYISESDADRATQETLNYAPPSDDIKAPHFVFYIQSLLEEKYDLATVEQGGLRVTTTLDLSLQESAEASVAAELENLDQYRVSNGAALVTNPQTGEVLAMVGSKDFFNDAIDGKVNVTTRRRQPGSSIKPLNYVTALQAKKITPATVLLDIPTCFQVTGQPVYCPKNYDGSSHGPVDIRTALANSYNVPAVKVLAINTLEQMIETATHLGISTFTNPDQYGLSLTLGGGEVTMLDMAVAFGTLANQGVKVPLHPILKIEDYAGKTLEEYHPETTTTTLEYFMGNDPQANAIGQEHEGLTRILNREPAFQISDILSDNNARTTAFGANSKLRIPGKTISVKTGTTNDLKDNWTIGYTKDRLVATWVGNNDNTPMNPYVVSGVTGAAPIWNDIMSLLLKDKEDTPIPIPAGIEKDNTCTILNDQNQPTITPVPCTNRLEYFWKDSPPTPYPVERKNIWVYKDTGLPAFFGIKSGDSANLDNLELKEHLIASDPFTPEFCLDCPWVTINSETSKPQNNYPTTTVDITTFKLKEDQPLQ